jgi:lysozyme
LGLSIYEGAGGSKFVCDNTNGFGDAVAMISRRAQAPVQSCARERAAEPLLRRIGKMSQRELFACSQNCVAACHGNCNPANPPGRSTHERRNDGVAYPAWVPGVLLPYWARGIDVRRDRVAAFCAEARRAGWIVTATYPGSLAESQHVNFRKRPPISLWEVRPVRKGFGGPRAREVIKALSDGEVLDPGTRQPYLKPHKSGAVDGAVVRAIQAFQVDHHQKPDGIVGVHTITALRTARRARPAIISARGIDLIKGFEGLRLYAYPDSGGNATVGWGHLLHKGPVTHADVLRYGTKEKPLMSRVQADRLLLEDVHAKVEVPLRKLTPRLKLQREYDGFGSAVFNLGPGVLDKGRSLGDALRAGKIGEGAQALLLYVHDRPGGPVVPGLLRRRRAERDVVLSGKYPS